jgi:subtilase family serine protease
MALKRVDAPSAAPSGYGPADLKAAYALPSGGAGATVAVVDAYDDPSAERDLATYRARFGLPECSTANGCFRKVNQRGEAGSLPTPDVGWAGEIALDVDMVSAVCPACHILLVEADSSADADLGTAVGTAVSMGARYVSNSYGGPESPGETDEDAQWYHHPGVAITASSGDDGYGVSYPASSPYVTAVGGTTLTRDGSARGFSETAWSGAGSGCSAYEPRPPWQTDATGCERRAVADVSAVADPETGLAVYNSYQDTGWNVYGGTSAAAPIVAAMYALAGTPGPQDDPVTYPWAHPGAFHDVTSGANGACDVAVLCKAVAGWDGPTGLGAPNGVDGFAPGAAAD